MPSELTDMLLKDGEKEAVKTDIEIIDYFVDAISAFSRGKRRPRNFWTLPTQNINFSIRPGGRT